MRWILTHRGQREHGVSFAAVRWALKWSPASIMDFLQREGRMSNCPLMTKKTKIITFKNSNKISLPFTLLDNGHALVMDELPKSTRNLNILE
jgi:hypothetical protein